MKKGEKVSEGQSEGKQEIVNKKVNIEKNNDWYKMITMIKFIYDIKRSQHFMRIKVQATDWKKILAKHMSEKKLLPKI